MIDGQITDNRSSLIADVMVEVGRLLAVVDIPPGRWSDNITARNTKLLIREMRSSGAKCL